MQVNKGNIENSARLKGLISALDLQPAAFGREMGYSKTAIYQILSGVRAISDNFIFRLGTAFPKVNPDWLLAGKGEMFREGAIEDAAEAERLKAENARLQQENQALKAEVYDLLKKRGLIE